MSTSFAALEQRLGAVTAALLANATLAVAAVSIDGVYDQVDVQPAMGGARVQSQRSQFVFETALLGAATLQEGSAVTVTYLGTPLALTVALRTDHEVIGQTVLDLKLA